MTEERALATIDQEIAEFRRHMANREMSNDRYYTDGSRQRDLDHLDVLQQQRAAALAVR